MNKYNVDFVNISALILTFMLVPTNIANIYLILLYPPIDVVEYMFLCVLFILFVPIAFLILAIVDNMKV